MVHCPNSYGIDIVHNTYILSYQLSSCLSTPIYGKKDLMFAVSRSININTL